MGRTRSLILGAAGRDFHNFNVVYRNDPDTEVVGFTAEQIPGIEERVYPPALAGEHYPEGRIRIYLYAPRARVPARARRAAPSSGC